MKRLMTKIIFCCFCLIIMAPMTVFSAPIKTATYQLGTFTNAQITWAKNTFNMIVNSDYSITDPLMISGFNGELWTTYLDITTLATLKQYLDMYDWAIANSVNPEEMLLHAKVDYTSGVATPWQNIDKFDVFESAKGVMLADGTDKTTVAYSGASPYTTINQTMYVGYQEPFAKMIFDVRTAATSLVGSWQYWNGSTWSTLTVTDGTSAMTIDGTISFTPPSDWARTIVNSSRNKYFVRFAFISASTAPVINTIKGDNWINDGVANHVRGWDATSGSIVNKGELAYNPTPPAGASAKFRYQARVPTWSANHFIFNIADFQMIGGASKRTCAAYLAQSTVNSVNAIPYTGMMYDDGIFPSYVGSGGTMPVIDPTKTDFSDKTSNSTLVEGLARWQDLYEMVKASKPSLILGLNAYVKNYVKAGDFNLYEYFNYTAATGDQDNRKLATTDSSTNMCYDDYLDSNNPGKPIKGMMIYEDSGVGKNYTVRDQGNRGPITALSKHLIGMNDNTTFAYFTNGSAIYSERDDFYYTAATGTTLASGLTADTSTASKTFSGIDFSAFNVTYCVVIGSGDTREVIRPPGVTKTGNTITTTRPLYFNHSAGEPVQYCQRGNFNSDIVPSQDRMVRWANYFPAMAVNFGTPSTRNLEWAKGTDYGWPNLVAYGDAKNTNIWSRDFSNALVLHRPSGGIFTIDDYRTPSVPIALGGTYYPLNADGTTGAAITSIQLRRAEGAILMKFPIQKPIILPAPAPLPQAPAAPRNVIKK